MKNKDDYRNEHKNWQHKLNKVNYSHENKTDCIEEKKKTDYKRKNKTDYKTKLEWNKAN